MKENIGHDIDDCIPTYIHTCEKNIYPVGKMESKTEVNPLERPIEYDSLTENAFTAREINLENILSRHQPKKELISKRQNFDSYYPADFLSSIEPYLPKEMISYQNYAEIKNLAKKFTGNLTSFFGFESRLGNPKSKSDYMLSISSKRGEREALFDYLFSNNFPEKFKKQTEWARITNFTACWADTKSSLYDKILGIWFEFDIVDSSTETPIPNIFLHTISVNKKDHKNIQWLTKIALPFLIGQNLSQNIEKQLLNSIKKLPENASLFNVGIMLSRPNYGMRVVVKRLNPKQIVPYLKSLGWSDETNELCTLVNELNKYSNRIVLSFDILETGIGPKIGIECGFYPKDHDEYAPEPRWRGFLNYLVSKNLCLPEKCNVLLDFVFDQEPVPTFMSDEKQPLIISTKIQNEEHISTLVRQIGHIKIVYKSHQPLEAKAYYGARLFSMKQSQYTKMVR